MSPDAQARTQLLAEIDDLGLDVDVLVLCAGFGMVGPFLAQPFEQVTAMVRTNVEALMALTHAFATPMAARRAGAVLIVSSMAGNQPMPHFGAYAATKAAVTSFAESLHCELRASGPPAIATARRCSTIASSAASSPIPMAMARITNSV